MYDYLQELFHHEDESNRLRFDGVDGYTALEVALNHCHDEIDRALGRAFSSEYWELRMRQADLEHLACFRHGFRLAVRLMLS